MPRRARMLPIPSPSWPTGARSRKSVRRRRHRHPYGRCRSATPSPGALGFTGGIHPRELRLARLRSAQGQATTEDLKNVGEEGAIQGVRSRRSTHLGAVEGATGSKIVAERLRNEPGVEAIEPARRSPPAGCLSGRRPRARASARAGPAPCARHRLAPVYLTREIRYSLEVTVEKYPTVTVRATREHRQVFG